MKKFSNSSGGDGDNSNSGRMTELNSRKDLNNFSFQLHKRLFHDIK